MGEQRKQERTRDPGNCGNSNSRTESSAIRRGEIYLAALDCAIGHEQRGERPVLVVQNNAGNINSGTTIVAAITSKAKPRIPTHVMLRGAVGLDESSCVMLEQIRTLDKSRLGRKIGRVSERQLRDVDAALAVSLGIKGIPGDFMVLTLCKTCQKAFKDSGEYLVMRTDFEQRCRETCTMCNTRLGYDFKVVRK